MFVCDGAGWRQTDGAPVTPDLIVVLRLPPYSPELNPMANVWDDLRRNKLCSAVWGSYDEIIEACKTAWNWRIDDRDRIRAIGARNWARVNV